MGLAARLARQALRRLPLAGERLSGLAEASRPSGRCPA
jgi:hypothetical protein